jgi:hypothetical protein
MTDWANEFRSKFMEDLDSAKNLQNRAIQTLDLVKARQNDLWRSLKDMAETAVGEIGEKALLFTVNDPYGSGEKEGFRILYTRDGKPRLASVSFRPKAHYVDLVFSVPGKDVPTTKFEIVATDDNQVVFSNPARSGLSLEWVAGGFNPETIVRYILNQLLGDADTKGM